ncbi:hypothetical protein [uncultured Methanomethylovorans sp.]|uniref:hypothetical protein n=1 Tax=uncultured Methanomethylovorans sp. TaxID=183759 RepID=UPI002AA60299|nr:hypothetical protein [uncultured Methanomethylovorans sp.]
MSQKVITLEERVKHIEKALLSFIFFTLSWIPLSDTSSTLSLYGGYGIIFFLAFFIVFSSLTTYYSSLLAFSVFSDTPNKVARIIIKYKEKVSMTFVFFIIISAIIVLKYLSFDLKEIAGSIVLVGLASVIYNFKKICSRICERISKIDEYAEKKNLK